MMAWKTIVMSAWYSYWGYIPCETEIIDIIDNAGLKSTDNLSESIVKICGKIKEGGDIH